MKPPPKIMPIPPRRQKAAPIKLRIARIVTPTGLPIRISSFKGCSAAAYCIHTLPDSSGEIYGLSKDGNLECHGFRYCPAGCAAGSAGDKCTHTIGESGDV